VKGDVSVGCAAQAKLDMVAKPLRAGRILRGLLSDSARALTLLMAEESSAVESGAMSTSAAHVTCSCSIGNSNRKKLVGDGAHAQYPYTRLAHPLYDIYRVDNDETMLSVWPLRVVAAFS
jgi:hypothetical protein